MSSSMIKEQQQQQQKRRKSRKDVSRIVQGYMAKTTAAMLFGYAGRKASNPPDYNADDQKIFDEWHREITEKPAPKLNNASFKAWYKKILPLPKTMQQLMLMRKYHRLCNNEPLAEFGSEIVIKSVVMDIPELRKSFLESNLRDVISWVRTYDIETRKVRPAVLEWYEKQRHHEPSIKLAVEV